MASIPQVYSDYALFPTNDFSELNLANAMVTTGGNCGGVALWGGGELESSFVPSSFDDLQGLELDQTVSPSELYSEALSTTAINPSYQAHDTNTTTVLALPELNTQGGMCGIAAGGQNFYVGYQPEPADQFQLYEFGDDSFGFVPDMKPVYHPVPTQNWEIQSNIQVPAIEDSNMKVSRYSEEVRKERILRYLKKRNQRNFNKTIKYACRKTLADRRIRVRGRFARNNEACHDHHQEIINPQNNNINDTNCIHDKDDSTEELYDHNNNVGVQLKKDEEEWIQEITSLMYFPYITS